MNKIINKKKWFNDEAEKEDNYKVEIIKNECLCSDGIKKVASGKKYSKVDKEYNRKMLCSEFNF